MNKQPWHVGKNPPRWAWLLAGLVLLVALLFGAMAAGGLKFFAKNSASVADVPSAQPVLSVEAIRPVLMPISHSIDASGVIVGRELAQVGAKANGVAIEQVLVAEGDRVRAGQVLALLDNSIARQQEAAAVAELNQAQIALEKARVDLLRAQPLIAIDAISRAQFDAYQVAQAQAQTQVAALQARLASTQIAAQNTQVLAPVAGVIGKKNADVGMLTTGAALFEIIKDGALEWQASLDPESVQQLVLGTPVEIMADGKAVAGEVQSVSPVANNSRQLTVHAAINSSPLLHSGMYVAGRFLLGQEPLPVLPYAAIVSSDGMDYVWTLSKYSSESAEQNANASNDSQDDLYQVQRHIVRLGAPSDDGVAVDISPNTLVVKQGGAFLQAGDVVRLTGIDLSHEQTSQKPAKSNTPPTKPQSLPQHLPHNLSNKRGAS